MLTSAAMFLVLMAPTPTEPAGRAVARHPDYDAVLVCDEPVHDFGIVEVAPVLQHEFHVRNEGTQTAFVKIVPAGGWGCQAFISPGETILVPISLRSQKIRGAFEKGIRVTILPPNWDEVCGQCQKSYETQEHAAQCGPSCYERRVDDSCVRRILSLRN